MNKMIFKARQHFVACNQLLQFSPDAVFPLLCPRREYEWIESWRGEIIYSKSGFAELDCVFSTEFAGGAKEIWVVDQFYKNEKIQFIRFTESRVIRYCISLKDNNNGTTTATWEMTITSLNDEGDSYIENFSDTDYEGRIKGLEKMLNHYLATGGMLKMAPDD
jgi:hypothetical protein